MSLRNIDSIFAFPIEIQLTGKFKTIQTKLLVLLGERK